MKTNSKRIFTKSEVDQLLSAMNWRGVMKVMRLLRWKYQGVPVTMKSAVGAARHCAESVAFDKCVISSTTGGFLAQWELADGCQQISLAFQPFQSETIGQ